MIRVLIVDEHDLIRQGIQSRLAHEADIVIVGEAGCSGDALVRIRSLRPDIVLMDPLSPDLAGNDAIASLISMQPDLRVIVLTASAGDLGVRRAFAAGARAYLLKGKAQADLADTIRQVMSGQFVIDPEVKRDLAARSGDEDLRSRELQVLRLVADGLTNRAIGERLAISEGTVKNHVKHILSKLRATDRTHAVVIGMTRGLLDRL